jgi:hypothetical protein
LPPKVDCIGLWHLLWGRRLPADLVGNLADGAQEFCLKT